MKRLAAFLFLALLAPVYCLQAQDPTPVPTLEATPLPTAEATVSPEPSATPKAPVMSQDAINVIKELTKIENTPNRLSGGLWLPAEYFQLVLKDNPNVPPASLEKILRSFANYTVVGIIDAAKNPDGSKTYSSPSAIFNQTELRAADGHKYTPLDEIEVDVSIARLLAVMKPKLRELAGSFGENMSLLVFPGKNPEGVRIADPLAPGKLEILSNGHSLVWKLPLASMVPTKTCPTCGEKFNGSYRFCPFDATALP